MFTRRKFIGTIGATAALATAGCATQPAGKLMGRAILERLKWA